MTFCAIAADERRVIPSYLFSIDVAPGKEFLVLGFVASRE